ncbi:TraB/GumN family protein [Marilutibacter spongiae]|uniref:TraB/GumN family protein n=1 Tax=Marilutibacter spongiae TaxID=2025720 RepID=A0A7W3Y5Q2_9GAMM|nr:TraB/GumN family protein [Lysobacter spongiae]MBB1060643.1 TraB/GumN family protein [Lysobacter spongiae]
MHPIRSMLIAGLLACTLPLAALPADAASQPAVGDAAPDGTPPVPLLWKVSDADNSIYLLGSFHLLKPSDYPTAAEIDAAFDQASEVVFEIPPAALADPATGMKMLQASGYADGRSLSQVLAPGELEQLDALFRASGQSVASVEAYEPWFINLSLVMGMSQAMGFDSTHGLDQHLIARAADKGKPTAGLETIDAQLAALDGMPMEEQVESLVEFVQDPAQARVELAQMHDAWRQGDTGLLETLAIDEMKSRTPESYRLVNVARNDAWLPELQAMLDDRSDEDVLVVVGAMHLLGEDGLVDKLSAAGYAVERMCGACSAE